MKKTFLTFLGFYLLNSAFSSAQAASLTFTLDEFTGTNAQVNITLDDAIAGANAVRVTAAVESKKTGTIGDIVGLFFNLKDNSLIPNLTLTPVAQTPGNPLTVSTTKGVNKLFLDNSGSTKDNIKAVDKNVNLNGGGETRDFEVGVQIGDGGLKGTSDDYQFVSFDLKATGLDLVDFSKESFGVRLQSVGFGKNREGSSKLEGNIPPYSPPPPKPPITEIPEPNTTTAIALFSLGLLGFSHGKSYK
jgi:hypothetical protein